MQALHDFFSKLLGLPVLAAETGKGVDELIIYIHLLMGLLFIGWFGYFVYALWKFRRAKNPKADYVGVRNHSSNYIEGLVAVVEAALLLFVAIPVWAKAVDKFPAEKDSTVIQLVAQQYDWNVRYPGKDGIFGKQEMRLVSLKDNNIFGVDPNDPHGKDDAQAQTQIHAVVNKPVIMYISSMDVIHSFKVLALRVTQDAIPGMRIPIWFQPTQTGTYQINCAQLCGAGHSAMSRGLLIIESQEEFDKWLATKSSGPVQSLE